jgi:hypothetical protein
LAIDRVSFGEALEVGKQGAERDQVFEPAARPGERAAGGEYGIGLHAAGLIDCQRLALDRRAGRTHLCGTREVAARVREAMRRRGDLGLDEGRSKGLVLTGK